MEGYLYAFSKEIVVKTSQLLKFGDFFLNPSSAVTDIYDSKITKAVVANSEDIRFGGAVKYKKHKDRIVIPV